MLSDGCALFLFVPAAMFGSNPFERVMPERMHLLAVITGELHDLGTFKVNVSKSQNGTRMKVSLGSTGTIYKRFPENTYMV